jgi:hypothetical protein
MLLELCPRPTKIALMKKLPKSIRKQLMALASQPDSTINYSDIPESKREDWAGAARGKFFRPPKVRKPRHG